MRVLVFSDSHGRQDYIICMLEKEKDCKTVFFLGDGEKEVLNIKETYKDRSFICVRGNNDFYSQLERVAYKHIDGVTFMACHGDRFDVRFSRRELYNKASAVRAQVALYGHTHVPKVEFDSFSKVCAVNPGALCNGAYCVIETDKGRFDIIHKEL